MHNCDPRNGWCVVCTQLRDKRQEQPVSKELVRQETDAADGNTYGSMEGTLSDLLGGFWGKTKTILAWIFLAAIFGFCVWLVAQDNVATMLRNN